MIKTVARWLFYRLIDRPQGPATPQELLLVEELRSSIRTLPRAVPKTLSEVEALWVGYQNRFRDAILSSDPREFLRWDFILTTMFVANAPYILRELLYLRSKPDWKSRWKPAINEQPAGHPLPYFLYPPSSGNLIHHAYHLRQFEDRTGVRIDRLGLIVEFGGGYGGMCRLIHQLGFCGTYVVLDLAEFSALQRFFLKSLGLPVKELSSAARAETGIFLVSDQHALGRILDSQPKARSAFIATWSLSETPLASREALLQWVLGFDAFLIAYQAHLGEVDNTQFFTEWRRSLAKSYQWQEWPIRHLPGTENRYLVGVSSGAASPAAC